MTAPRLNRRLTLEAPKRLEDGAGGYTTSWETLGTLWADLSASTGGERSAGQAPVSAVRYKITVRSAPEGSPQRPLPEQRFRDGNRVFRIRAIIDTDPNGAYLVCVADEEVVA